MGWFDWAKRRHLSRAAHYGMGVLMVNPDPDKAVRAVQFMLDPKYADAQIAVTRPAVAGRTARIQVRHDSTTVVVERPVEKRRSMI